MTQKKEKIVNEPKVKKLSCGIVILNEQGEILMGHSTGNKFYDIPKGELDAGETPIACAIRECEEECGLKFESTQLKDLGQHAYNKEKDLHLFLVRSPKAKINMEKLVCNSFFEHYFSKKMVPEVDSFEWIPVSQVVEKCAKSMGKLLSSLSTDQLLNYSTEPPIKNKP